MRILFVAGPTASNVLGLSPLASALRMAGHDVVMAASQETCPVVTRVGHTAYPTTALSLGELLAQDPATGGAGDDEIDAAGRRFGRLAAAMLDRLLEFAEVWRPHLVVCGPHAYAGALLAARLGIPWMRHTLTANEIDRSGVHPGVEAALAPELARFGVARVPEPALVVDLFPPSLRPPGERLLSELQPLRWIPTSHPASAESWMFDTTRRRILLTAGSLDATPGSGAFLRELAGDLADPEVELLVACPEEMAGELRDIPGVSRAGWLPFDILAPTLDLVVHHGGGLTALTAVRCEVPQVVLPLEARNAGAAARMCTAGAGVALPSAEADVGEVAAACRTLLADPVARRRVRSLAHEMADMPPPTHVVGPVTDRVAEVVGA